MADTQMAPLALQALTLGSVVLGAAVFLLLGLRREKIQNHKRLTILEEDLRIKTARLIVRNAERRGEQPPAQEFEDAKKPTSEERAAGEATRNPLVRTWPRGRWPRKAQAEQRAWDSLRSMVELYCAIPDEPGLQTARRLARAEYDRRLVDWVEKSRAAYGRAS